MPRMLLVVLLLAIAFPAGLVQAQTDAPCVGGKPSSPVKIEVFSDYQCPACRAFYLGTMKQVLTEYGDAGKVCVVYHEFPLSMHPHAPEAARYGHAALQLGVRQWFQVTNALFEAQPDWAASGKLEPVVAGALSKEDMDKVRKMVADPATLNAAIKRDIELGQGREVNSTPTFFITAKGKTEKVASVVQFPIMKRYLDHLLSE